jgi:hypothetical protein
LPPGAKATQLADWLESRQSLLSVAATTTAPSGQTLDWIPLASQSATAIATPPPAARHATAQEQARPTRAATFDVGEPGPPGHVPVLRPNLAALPRKLGLDRLRAKRGGLFANSRRPPEAEPVDPDPKGYFHALSEASATAYGCDGWFNCWAPTIDVPASSGDDHSIAQTWLQNYQKPLTQSIEAGLTVDAGLNNGDKANHLFTYYTTNGYTSDGDDLGGYNRLDRGWVQYHATIYPGIRVLGTSVPGGTQFELGMKYRLWQGNWWFAVNDTHAVWTWIGYYPGTLFQGGIADRVDWTAFGGEVYSGLADPCATKDQMGSGHKAADGWRHAAFQRLLHVQTTRGGTMADFAGSRSVDAAASGCGSNEYTIACSMNSGSSWASYQFLGGPTP